VIRFWRRRRRSLLGAVVAAAGILTIAGCASSARAGAGAVPPLQIDYPDFELTPIPGSSIPIPDNAVPFDVATSPLPTASQSAEVWTWPAGPASARDVKTLAKELGLDGDPPRVADGWQVGTATAMVRVYDDPGWPWSYTTSKTPVSWTVCIAGGNFGPYFNCDNNPPSPPPSPTGSPSPQPTISAPGLDQAPSIAKPLLTALGVTGPISVSSIGRDGITTLDVPPSVQGMPTNGFRVWIQVDSTGVVTASGWLATPKPGAVYPLISAMQAFDLSNGWTGGFCAAAAVAPTSTPPADAPSCQPPSPQNVTDAVLGLDLEWQNKQPILLPAWFFSVEGTDGPVLGTVAIDRAYLRGPPTYSTPGTPPPSTPPSPSP
jgi:hypothetical protein